MHRRKKKSKFHVKIVVALMILIGFGIFFFRGLKNYEPIQAADLSNGWNLILVNSEYRIPDDYQKKIELTTLSNGRQVDSRIYPDLQAMFDDARAAGLQLFVRAGYRTGDEQRQLLNEKISQYQSDGYSKTDAEKLAKEWVATPGTSEHEIGIAVDINADTSSSTKNEVYTWLENNSYRYGFIKRYPSNKADITGISNEPWHYRYVGKEAAKKIYEEGICLEEYREDYLRRKESRK